MKNFEFEGIEIKTAEELREFEAEKIYTAENDGNEEYIDSYQKALEEYLYDTLYSVITENDRDYNEEILYYIIMDYDYIWDADRTIIDRDLEKGYERGFIVFNTKDKYCSIDFYYSPYNGTVIEFKTIKEVQRKARIEYYYE